MLEFTVSPDVAAHVVAGLLAFEERHRRRTPR